jgi:hypothetical protein
MVSTTQVVVADTQRLIDLLLDHVFCDPCLRKHANLPHARVIAVWQEMTRRFSSAKTVAGTCEHCGEDASLHRLAS